MKTLVIYAHPYKESFNHHILDSYINENSHSIDVIDLYKDEFNLIYSKEELSLFKTGETSHEKVKNYQNRIKQADKLVFIFPIWWNSMPGMVKNFIDLVMKKNFAYVDTKTGVSGKLTHIKSLKVFSTSTSPTWYLRYFCGNYIEKVFFKATCRQMGIKNTQWINLGNIGKATNFNKEKFIDKIKVN